MRANKVACHIGQVSCMNLEFSLVQNFFTCHGQSGTNSALNPNQAKTRKQGKKGQ